MKHAHVFALTLFVLIAVKPALAKDDCSLDLMNMEDQTLKKHMDLGVENGHLKFTEENKRFFKHQRDALRLSHQKLTNSFVENEHTVNRTMLARMGEVHAYLYGGPGGAKSGISRELMYAPVKFRGIDRKQNVFMFQCNQLMTDLSIKGYIDPDVLKDKLRTLVDALVKDGTMIDFPLALIDEVDKANPILFSALLEVINERIASHGGITLDARTKTMITTSNMTFYEFLAALASQQMEPTARAFLDRITYKIFVANQITDKVARQKAFKMADEAEQKKSLSKLANTDEMYYTKQDRIINDQFSSLPGVHYEWFGKLANVSLNFNESAITSIDEIYDEVKIKMFDLRRSTEKKAKDDPSVAVYYPPQIASTRNFLTTVKMGVKHSLFLDLLNLPEEVLSSDELISMIEKGIEVSELSSWRVQHVLLTAAPGEPHIYAVGKDTAPKIEYGPELAILEKNPFDEREAQMLSFLTKERQWFIEAYEAVTTKSITSGNAIAEILQGLMDGSKKKGNIELFFMDVKPPEAKADAKEDADNKKDAKKKK